MGLLASPALFALVGGVSTVIDVAVFWILLELAQAPALLANAVSYSVGAVNSFLLNKLVTFRHRQTSRSSAQQLAAFVVVRVVCLGVSSLALAVALPFMSSLAAKGVSVVVAFALAYALSSRLVFR